MPQIVMSKLASGKLDGSDAGPFVSFLTKLGQDDTTPGLHIEPMKNAVDRRVRTGRVNDRLRAVLVKLKGPSDSVYVVHGVWDHDEAIRIARTLRAEVNPINGQVLISEAPAADEAFSARVEHSEQEDAWRPEEKYSWLGAIGHTERSMYEAFGLPPEVGRRALEAQSQDELLDIAAEYSGWVSDVILGLAAGDSETIIKETLELMRPVPEAQDEDEAVLEALTTNVAKSQYTVVEGEEELLRVLEGGSFSDWRKFLHPEQRKYASDRWHGPFRLSGAAGTGKTVVLLHRAVKLNERYPGSRILLTTFTTTLAQGLEEQLELLDPTIRTVSLGEGGVCVNWVDSAVARILQSYSSSVKDAARAVLGDTRPELRKRTGDDSWEGIGDRLGSSPLPAKYRTARFLREEYEAIVLPHRITTEEEYLRVRRPGRGTPLNRARRRQVWGAIEEYRQEMRIQGGLSFPEATAVAAYCLEQSGDTWVDHALVDEGQDLSALQWQFLRALVKPGDDDLFIAEDSEQRIYAAPVVLGHYGIKIVGRSRRLMLSYRTTAQNLDRAVKALEGVEYLTLDGAPVSEEQSEDFGTSGYRAIRNGPEPHEYATAGAEYLDVVAGQVQEWVDAETRPDAIGVLASDGYVARRLTEHLLTRGVDARQVLRSRASGNHVQVMTMHRAKGLEFEKVVAVLPPLGVADLDEDRALRQRSLHYVAMSRARDELAVVHVSG